MSRETRRSPPHLTGGKHRQIRTAPSSVQTPKETAQLGVSVTKRLPRPRQGTASVRRSLTTATTEKTARRARRRKQNRNETVRGHGGKTPTTKKTTTRMPRRQTATLNTKTTKVQAEAPAPAPAPPAPAPPAPASSRPKMEGTRLSATCRRRRHCEGSFRNATCSLRFPHSRISSLR